MSGAAFRQLLEAGDVRGVRRAWKQGMPGMPQPVSDEQAEIVMHIARTAAKSVKFRCRAYSHRWLLERNIPSQLPDEFRPKAERMYPVVAEGVGVSVRFNSPLMAPAAVEVQTAVNAAIEDCYAEGRTRVSFVRRQMDAARDRTLRALFGR